LLSRLGERVFTTLNMNAALLPTATRVFISVEKCLALLNAEIKNDLPEINITGVVNVNRMMFVVY